MSKEQLQAYAPDDQAVIKQLMPFLVELRLSLGAIPETHAALKAAMPGAFGDVCAVIDVLNKDLARYSHVDGETLRRIKVLSLKFLVESVARERGPVDRALLLSTLARSFADARQVTHAVDEYLCG